MLYYDSERRNGRALKLYRSSKVRKIVEAGICTRISARFLHEEEGYSDNSSERGHGTKKKLGRFYSRDSSFAVRGCCERRAFSFSCNPFLFFMLQEKREGDDCNRNRGKLSVFRRDFNVLKFWLILFHYEYFIWRLISIDRGFLCIYWKYDVSNISFDG